MKKMKILMVTPEIAPFVKVGGLADVVGALPKELARRGHDVRVVCPMYGSVNRIGDWSPLEGVLIVHMGDGERYARVWETQIPGTNCKAYFLEHHDYFAREQVYTGPWGSHGDNGERFAFLSRGAFDLCGMLDWYPDVIHAHDWPTGLVPVILNAVEHSGPFSRTASVLTIHNLEHQGVVPPETVPQAGLPDWTFRQDGLESVGHCNMLKGGIYHATKITTVSPTYAREIQEPTGGCGIDDVLRFRSGDLIGILNGIDTEVWNPSTDPLIPAPYAFDRIEGKATCKEALQRRLGLEVDPTIPVFGMVSRLAHQKGLDLLLDAIHWAMREMRVQFVILGSGEEDLQWKLGGLPAQYSGRVGAFIGFNNELAHWIEAGSDFFLMPSRFEPCGLNQMYSMRYGTIPIVRATGGLVDSVEQCQEGQDRGTGFMFWHPNLEGLYYTIGWACATWYDRPEEYRAMQRRAMTRDFSWATSAQHYRDVYAWALETKGHRFS